MNTVDGKTARHRKPVSLPIMTLSAVYAVRVCCWTRVWSAL